MGKRRTPRLRQLELGQRQFRQADGLPVAPARAEAQEEAALASARFGGSNISRIGFTYKINETSLCVVSRISWTNCRYASQICNHPNHGGLVAVEGARGTEPQKPGLFPGNQDSGISVTWDFGLFGGRTWDCGHGKKQPRSPLKPPKQGQGDSLLAQPTAFWALGILGHSRGYLPIPFSPGIRIFSGNHQKPGETAGL